MRIFELSKGNKFKMANKVFTITAFKKEYRPTLGRVLVCYTDCEGKIAKFLRNWECEKVEEVHP